MTKQLTSVRLSALTRRQLDELTEHADMTQAEAHMLGVDRIWRDWFTGNADAADAVRTLTHLAHSLEDISFSEWPALTGEQAQAIETLLAQVA